MSENYARSALRVSVAQICQVLGWDAVQLSACDLLSDVLDRYIQQLARSCHRYAELYGRTDPVLSDIGRAFGLLGVNLSELEDFVNHLEPVSFPQTTHLFPVAKSSTLQFPSPSEERRDYIPDYLPPLVSLQEDEEEEPVPVAMGTSAEAMQVSLEEDDGEDDYDEEAENAENRPAKREADEALPLGVMPTAKRPRLGPSLNPDASPEWTSELRDPLSTLNTQMPPSPSSSSPPLSPAPTPIGAMMARPPVTPGRKPPRPTITSPGRKSKSPRRGGGSNASPGRGTPKLTQKEKKKKNSPRSPRGGGAAAAHVAQMASPPLGLSQRDGRAAGTGGAGGRSAGLPHSDLHLQRSSMPDTGDADIEDSISAVIARACSGGGGAGSGRPHDPYDLPSDSDSDSDPGLTLSHTLLGRSAGGGGGKNTHAHTPVGSKQAGRAALTSTPLFPCSMDRSIDEVVRQAGKRGGGAASISMVTTSDPDDLSSPPPSPPTPQPLLPGLTSLPWQQSMGMDEFSLSVATGGLASTEGKKKKPKKEAKLKLKKLGKIKGHKEKDKGHEKLKSKDKKKDKKSKEKEAKLTWKEEVAVDGGRRGDDPFSMAAAAAAAALSVAEERRDKEKHKDKKKDREKSKKDKASKRDKGKERAKEGKKKKKMSAEEREREASLALFGPAACLLLPSSIPHLTHMAPTAAAAIGEKAPLGGDKPLKSKEKEKKKDKKEKKKKKDKEKEKEREKERGKEKELEKEEKKKGKEKEKGGKAKEKAKETAKQEKVKAAEPPVVLSSPVIPRLTLRVGAGQDKIVISKVVPDSEPGAAAPPTPLPPPVKAPGARSGPGSRGRAPSTPAASVAPPPPLPPPPPPAPLSLPPLTPPTPPPAPGSAKSGCSVVTETVSAYVVRDEWGNKIWICPGCNKPDDGSPMIGCDQCDDWYHWPCVGILTPPPEDQQWFCVKCAGKKTDKKQKKRRRKAN